MVNFVQRGQTITVLAPYTVTSGAGALIGQKFGISATDAASGTQLEIAVEGVFDLAKDTSTFTDGDSVYWDNTAKKATSTVSGNTLIGAACLTQPSGTAALGGNTGDATVRLRLNGNFGAQSSGGLAPGVAQTAVVSLSAANIIAMNATPVAILAPPGAGLAIVVDNILFEMNRTSTAFTGGGNVSFQYHTATTVNPVTSVILAAVVTTGGAGQTNQLLGPSAATNGIAVGANDGVDITNASAAFAAGTGTAKVFVKYRTITL